MPTQGKVPRQAKIARTRQEADANPAPLPPAPIAGRRQTRSEAPDDPVILKVARAKAAERRAIPKTLGAVVDALYSTRQTRLELQNQVNALATFENELKEYLINVLPKSDASGVAGRLARATITTKIVPTVEDWDAFYTYLWKTKDPSLLQKRVSDAAIAERWDAGKDVPGVGRFRVVGVGVNKL